MVEVLAALRRARIARGLTQAELARRSGLSQSTIASLERRPRADPPWSTVATLSRVLRMSPVQLFGLRPSKNGRGRREVRV